MCKGKSTASVAIWPRKLLCRQAVQQQAICPAQLCIAFFPGCLTHCPDDPVPTLQVGTVPLMISASVATQGRDRSSEFTTRIPCITICYLLTNGSAPRRVRRRRTIRPRRRSPSDRQDRRRDVAKPEGFSFMISKCITTRRLTEAAEEAVRAGYDTSMVVLPNGILLHCRGELREEIDFVSWAEITGAIENPLLARVQGFESSPSTGVTSQASRP